MFNGDIQWAPGARSLFGLLRPMYIHHLKLLRPSQIEISSKGELSLPKLAFEQKAPMKPSEHLSRVHRMSQPDDRQFMVASDIPLFKSVAMNIQAIGVAFRHFARSVGFDPLPRTRTELIEAVHRHHDRYFQTIDGAPMCREDRWGAHGGYFVRRVTLRLAGKELGWIEDVEIKNCVAYFGHFAVAPPLVGTGTALVMMQSYLAKLVTLYDVREAVFDLTRVRGQAGNYERFFTNRLLAVRDPNTPALFRWCHALEQP